MAQNSVHVTQTLQPKPSIFEVAAAESLQMTFQPALHRLAQVSQHFILGISSSKTKLSSQFLANSNPERWGWIFQYFDEVFLCLNALIQQHYIKSCGGSLAEVFYNLTRVQIKTGKLSSRYKLISLICIVLLPYANAKITKRIQKWSDELDEGVPMAPEAAQQTRIAVKLLKKIKASYGLLQCFQMITYLTNISKSHNVLNRLIGVQLSYLPPQAESAWTWSDFLAGKLKSSAIISSAIFRSLELSAFFLQFIQWWQNETTNGNLTKLPSPEAPASTVKTDGSRYMNLCPICLQKWRIPTVNRVSG